MSIHAENPALGEEDSRDLLELGRALIQDVDPDEMAIYEDVAADYLARPRAVLEAQRRDETVGFGLGPMLASPVVIDCLIGAALWLGEQLLQATAGEALGAGVNYLRVKFFGDSREPTRKLDEGQVRALRVYTISHAISLGMPPDRAASLADALVTRMTRSKPA